MELHEEPNLMWTLTNVPFPLFNNVFRAKLAPEDVEAKIEAAIARADARGVPMAWWTGPTTRPADLGTRLEKRGFAHAADAPMMAIDLHDLEENPHAPSDLKIDEALDVAALEVWNRVVTAVYEFPDFARRPWLDMHASLGLGPKRAWRHFTGAIDGEVVATASLFLGAGVAGIANVATVEAVRRRGIATALTFGLARVARNMGYRIGILFSSEMGEEMYRKLGFTEYAKGSLYIWEND
jgi:predicted GNAT family acetyltransferase